MEQAVEKLLSLPNRLESELQAGHHHHRHRGREQIRHAFHAHAPLKDLQRLQKVKEDEQNWCLKLTVRAEIYRECISLVLITFTPVL